MSRATKDPRTSKTEAARLSPVRRAHAEIARREGRAGAAGVLGLPLDGKGEEKKDAEATRNGRSEGNGGSRQSTDQRQSGGGGARARSRNESSASKKKKAQPRQRDDESRRESDDDDGERSQRRPSRTASEATGIAQRAGGAIAEAAGNAAQAVAEKAEDISTPDVLPSGGVKGKMVRFAARKVAARAAAGGARAAKAAIEHGAERLAESAERRASASASANGNGNGNGGRALPTPRRLPIQRSVDVAVPLELAWHEWMRFEWFTEGAHRVSDVQRKGDRLTGKSGGLSSPKWEAKVIEERRCESFAWQSQKGGDCAGLITFHQLSERLTRIELTLDARPVGVGETVTLALRLADHRAEAELRRFKAHAELINPDVYEEILGRKGAKKG